MGLPRDFELLHTWGDLCERPGPYLDAVREAGTSLTVRLGRGSGMLTIRLSRTGLAGGGEVGAVMSATQIMGSPRSAVDHLRAGRVVKVTRWGVVDGVLEVV